MKLLKAHLMIKKWKNSQLKPAETKHASVFVTKTFNDVL